MPVARWLLNLLYAAALLCASPWIVWRSWRTGRYREGFAAKLLGHAPQRVGAGPCVWFHAVSVGEVNLIATLVRRLQNERPEVACYISTTTRTGYELARKKYPEATVFYAPLDFSWAVETALDRIRPSLLILAELELWPNWIRAADTRRVPVTIINGRLSERSFRGYSRWRWLFAPTLSRITCVAAQTEEYAERFRCLGAQPARVHVTGSVKFDGARGDRGNPQTVQLAALAGIVPSDVVFLAGSTQEPEEAAALDAFRLLTPRHPELRLILVPRHPERFTTVAKLLDSSGIPWQRRSELSPTSTTTNSAHVLLVDTVGELGAWWGTAHIGFVGGSLGRRGGQNMIEPGAYGAAVCFGPNTQNFRDIVALFLAVQAAVVVPDAAGLASFVERCLSEVDYRETLGRRAKELVATQLGATERTWQLLAPLIPTVSPLQSQRSDSQYRPCHVSRRSNSASSA